MAHLAHLTNRFIYSSEKWSIIFNICPWFTGLPLAYSMARAPPCRALRTAEMSEASGLPWSTGLLPIASLLWQVVDPDGSRALVLWSSDTAVPGSSNHKLVPWLKCEITCELGGKQHGKNSFILGLVLKLRILYFGNKKCKRDARGIYCTRVWQLMSFNPFIYFRTFWAKCFVHWGRLLVHREVVWKSQ